MRRYSFSLHLKRQNPIIFHTICEERKEAIERMFCKFPPDIVDYLDVKYLGSIEGTFEELTFISPELLKEARMMNLAYPKRSLV